MRGVADPRLALAVALCLGASTTAAQAPEEDPLARGGEAVRAAVQMVVAHTSPCPRRAAALAPLLTQIAAHPDRLERLTPRIERAVSRCEGAPPVEPDPTPDRDALTRLAAWAALVTALRSVERRVQRRCVQRSPQVDGMPAPGADTSIARGTLVLAPDAAPSWPSASWEPCVGRLLERARFPTVAVGTQFSVRVSMGGVISVSRPSAP